MANQSLQNLRKIHDLQKDGEISKILKEIRTSKNKVDAFSEQINQTKKSLIEENKVDVITVQKEEPKEVKEEKSVEEVVEIKKEEPTFIKGNVNNNDKNQKQDFKRNDKSQSFNNRNQYNSNNRGNNQNNKFNQQRQNGNFNKDRNKNFNNRLNNNNQKNLEVIILYLLKQIIIVLL